VLSGLFTTWRHANELLAVAGLAVFGLGTSVILGPAAWGPEVLPDLSTWDLAGVVVWMSVATSFLFAYNLDLLHRVPLVGDWLKSARAGAVAQLSERRWIRRWAIFGVGFFVFLPLPASGTIGGAVIGRLLGLSRLHCFLAVAVGSAAAAMLYALFGAGIVHWTKGTEIPAWVRIATVLGLLVGIGLLARFMAKASKRGPSKDTK
jgi:uncharacterized membrane protein